MSLNCWLPLPNVGAFLLQSCGWTLLIMATPIVAQESPGIRQLQQTRLCPGCNLQKAKLRGAYLQGADLTKANLQEADLRSVNLSHTSLRYANLRNADLRGADLRGTDLKYADLWGAKLSHAQIDESTVIDPSMAASL